MMNKFTNAFLIEKGTLNCSLGDLTLTELFESWQSDDFKVYSVVNDSTIIIHNKNTSKVSDAVQVLLQYNLDAKAISFIITPQPKAYLFFLVVPLICVILFRAKDLAWWYWLLPLIVLIGIVFLLKISVKYERREFIQSIRHLLSLKSIIY